MQQVKDNNKLDSLLNRNQWPEDSMPSVCVSKGNTETLLERVEAAPVYAHTYPFFFNLQHGFITPVDLVEYAYVNSLAGCALHIHDGEQNSLTNMSKKERNRFGQYANDLGIKLSLETSHTDHAHLNEIVSVALDTGASDIRMYSRYQGQLSEVMRKISKDLEQIAAIGDEHDLYFNFEQHEELKSKEIVSLIEGAGSPRLGILFDFANMVNAYETPLQAIKTMAPYIRQVHLKGAKRVVVKDGWGQQAVPFKSIDDEIPAERLIYELLLLGKEEPQVKAFILEQEVGFYAPPFRHPGEDDDPYIPYREPSETELPEGMDLDQICLDERRYATEMIYKVRELLFEMQTAAVGK